MLGMEEETGTEDAGIGYAHHPIYKFGLRGQHQGDVMDWGSHLLCIVVFGSFTLIKVAAATINMNDLDSQRHS